METYIKHGYIVTDDEPKNGDMVLTDNYGVWEFRNEKPDNKIPSAPMPYWANAKNCKKIVGKVPT